MVRGIRKQHYNPTSRLYQIARNNMISANKERPGPSLGKKMTEETKLKISNTLKGRLLPPRSPEHSAKLGRYSRTTEQRQRVSESRKSQVGLQKRNDETKAKMSAWQKGIPKPKISCEYCGKEASLMNHKKWHGDNCKFKF